MRIINKRIVLHVKDVTEDDEIKLKENGYVYFEDDILNNQMFEKEEGSDIAIIDMSAGCGCCDAHVRIYNCPLAYSCKYGNNEGNCTVCNNGTDIRITLIPFECEIFTKKCDSSD